jgi:transmembrane sensor
VFARLEKAYGLSIVYDKAVLKNCQLTVPMTDEPFFTKLDIICQTIGASYKVEGTQVVITGAGCD